MRVPAVRDGRGSIYVYQRLTCVTRIIIALEDR